MSEKCGYEGTTTGNPCQHDKGTCPFPSHRTPPGEPAENPEHYGRPTKFNAERAQAAIKAAKIGSSIEGCARACGVSGDTVHDWKDDDELTFEDPDTGETIQFGEAFRRARFIGERDIIEGARDETSTEDAQTARFLLSTSYGYQKTEGREISGSGGGPIETQIQINEEVIKTGYDDDDTDSDDING